MDFTGKEIILIILGSGGFIGGLISAFVFITGRLDARRARHREELETEVSHSADMKRFELDSSNSVHAQLWQIIDAQKRHIGTLEKEAEELEQKAILQRPIVNKIYANIRNMRREIESLGVMALDDEATQIFMKRFNAVKTLLDDTEGMLP